MVDARFGIFRIELQRGCLHLYYLPGLSQFQHYIGAGCSGSIYGDALELRRPESGLSTRKV